jgi:hypothetical protein
MNAKLLTTTLVSMSLLSLNLFASGQMSCHGGFCMVKIQKPTPKIARVEVKNEIKVQETPLVETNDVSENTEAYQEVIVDNVKTIIPPHEKFVMTESEVVEYDLEEMQKSLTSPVLNEDLPSSDFLCEDNRQPIKVAGTEDTYECS